MGFLAEQLGLPQEFVSPSSQRAIDILSKRDINYNSLPFREVFTNGSCRLLLCTQTPSLGFLLDKSADIIPGSTGMPEDVRMRTQLILSGLCKLPTIIVPESTRVSPQALMKINEYMGKVASHLDLPAPLDMYVRTRTARSGGSSANLGGRGLLIHAKSPRYIQVGGNNDGQPVDSFDQWYRSLGRDVHLMIHMEHAPLQKEALHLQYVNRADGSTLLIGRGVPHARKLRREGQWLEINNLDPGLGLMAIAESRCIRQGTITGSSQDDMTRLAQLGLPAVEELMEKHRAITEVYGERATSEARYYIKPYASLHIMDIDVDPIRR